MSFRIINGQITNINPIQSTKIANENKKSVSESKNFSSILNEVLEKQNNVKISKHASQRLEERNIHLSTEDIEKISDGVNKAKDKGAKEGVVIYKDMSLVTSFKNNTIITALESGKENIITNIDSVILL